MNERIEHTQITFEVFCKTLLKNKARSIHRKQNSLESREVPLAQIENTLAALAAPEAAPELDEPIIFKVRDSFVCFVRDQQLAQSIRALLPRHREAVLLSFFTSYGETEICRILGIPISTLRSRRKAAIQRMRATMEASDGE